MPDSKPYRTPEGRDPFGLAHQLKVTIGLAAFTAPTKHERSIERRGVGFVEGAQDAIAERIMARIRRQFRVTWRGSDDEGDDARDPATLPPDRGEQP